MFNERRIISFYLLLFLFLPFIDKNKDKNIIGPWAFCTCILFIFPFFPSDLKDSLLLM